MPESESESESAFEREEEESVDPAQAPLIESGEGESEGFELAEQELEEHASHGDMHSTARITQDASGQNEDSRAAPDGEADSELTSERPDDEDW